MPSPTRGTLIRVWTSPIAHRIARIRSSKASPAPNDNSGDASRSSPLLVKKF